MKQVICTLLFILFTTSSRGQYTTRGKIYVNGRELEVVGHGPSYFEFNPFDTTLTTAALEYLHGFGRFYKDSLSAKKNYVIGLTPGLTVEEQKKDKYLGTRRIMVIMHYLETNFQIDRRAFKARYTETITADGCVAFTVSNTNSKRLTRKEKKKLKFEEDKYFNE